MCCRDSLDRPESENVAAESYTFIDRVVLIQYKVLSTLVSQWTSGIFHLQRHLVAARRDDLVAGPVVFAVIASRAAPTGICHFELVVLPVETEVNIVPVISFDCAQG